MKRLGLAWFYDLGAGGGGQEATPLVWNGVIYGITNWSVVFAVDARTGKERWRWDPEVNQNAVRPSICCGVVNRGVAIYQGLIIAPIIDGRLQALDIATGKPVWEARVAYSQDEYTLTIAPRIANGKVIVGISGGDHPKRGFFDAYDALTGRRLWRFYTIPGDPSKPFESSAMRRAAETWDPSAWKLGGGGAVWDGIAYDPDTDLVYAGTGNAEPWPEEFRGVKGKDGLYACSILAVHASTGELAWHYQTGSGRYMGFRQRPANDADRAHHQRQAAQGDHAGQQERLLLRAGPRDRRVHLSRAICQGELGEGRGPQDRAAHRERGSSLWP